MTSSDDKNGTRPEPNPRKEKSTAFLPSVDLITIVPEGQIPYSGVKKFRPQREMVWRQREEEMIIEADDRYFTALNAVISARLGAEHPCAMAAAKAARIPKHENMHKAQKEINRLTPEIRREVEDEMGRWMGEFV